MIRAPHACMAGWLMLNLAGLASAQGLPPGKGKDLVQRACTTCHELIIGSKQRMDRERWTAVVEDMVDRGASLSEEETAEVVEYLVTNFGPRLRINEAGVEQLVRELGLAGRDAEAIVKYRNAHGPYKDLSSLKEVPDVDPAKIDALKDRIVF
jgi:competence ComEA-like helix-hairpin-helix protein